MKCFLTWEEAYQAGVSLAGGKGWNLGRLARYGFNVPPGGVLTTGAYDEFIKQNGLREAVDGLYRLITLENLSESEIKDRLTQLKEKIVAGSIPESIVVELSGWLNDRGLLDKALAVRSSASAEDSAKASFAGIHDSFLNVHGLDQVLSAIKGCYASLWSPRAVAYRKKINISVSESQIALVIMEMVDAGAAGVGFTCDIQSGRQDIMVINANHGLGESVVNGAVEPDTYYLKVDALSSQPRSIERKIGRKQGMTVLKQQGGGTMFVKSAEPSAQPVLADHEIERLGLLLQRVFDALGNSEQHQDVEWVYDGRDFVLVQARPVTILPRKTFAALQNQPDIWSNGNYRDAVPMVISPIHKRLMKEIIDIIHDTSLTGTGYQIPVGIQFSRFYNGRLYCNISALQWGMYESFGGLPQDFNAFWGGHQPSIDIGDLKPLPGIEGRMMKSGALVNQARENAVKTWTRMSSSIQEITGDRPAYWSDRDFITRYDDLGRITEGLAREFNSLAAAGSIPVVMLMTFLTKYFQGREAIMLNALMVGGTVGITSADQGYQLVELAEMARRDADTLEYLSNPDFDPAAWEKLPERSPLKRGLREFIEEYGHRAVYELDIINPRWNEDPTYLLEVIRSTINTADLGKLKVEQREKQERAWLEIRDKVPAAEHSSIRDLVRESQAGAAVREKTKSVLAEVMEAYRVIARELGSRFYERNLIEEPDDVFFSTWSELFAVLRGEWDGLELRVLIEERKAWMREMEALSPPDVIFGDTPNFSEPAAPTSGNFLTAMPVAAGKASGAVRLINHPDQGSRLQPGEVMVAPSTDPGWTPLFLKAGGLVMETGGFLSHGAIVAREYGIPAVTNIPGVMGILKEGQIVVIDGDEGKVYL